MISVLLFILVLTFLIVIHELGHFFVAKWAKVHIEEFGIGLPPKLVTLFTWKGVPFTLNWIFLGGFVRMEGEEVTEAHEKKASKKDHDKDTYPFYARPLKEKLAVVVAGPLVNFVFGILVFAGIFSVYGIPTQVHPYPVLESIAAGSPAEKAGLRSGDEITNATSNEELISYINAHRGQEITLHVKERGEVKVYVRKVDEIPNGQGSLGIILGSQYAVKQYPLWQRPGRGIVAGVTQSFEFGRAILSSLGSIGTTLVAGRVPSDVSGPVGIANQAQKEGVFTNGLVSALNFAALLSINLAIMNLLPIPALDGGRAVLLIVEKFVRGKRFATVSYWLNTAGFVFLISLLLLITVKDIVGIIAK